MIRLNLAREPRRLDLGHGVAVTVLPLTSAVMMAAQAQLAGQGKVGSIDLIKAIGCISITDWEGVEGDDGAPAPVSPETVAALLDIYSIAAAFERLYIGPALTLASEKNG